MSLSESTGSVSSRRQLALTLDARGLTVYGSSIGLRKLVARLNEIANASAAECWEVHVRSLLFEGTGPVHGSGSVYVKVDEKFANFFGGLPEDAPLDANPAGFELTFMHIDQNSLSTLAV